MNDAANEFEQTGPGPGHNMPPEPTLIERLNEKYKADLAEVQPLLDTAKTVPERIDDDPTQKKAADLVRKMADLQRRLDTDLDIEKKPLEDDVKIIKATFNNPWDLLETQRKAVKVLTTDYTRRKDDAEKKRLAEIEAKKREEERVALQLAQEADTAKQNAARAVDAFEQQSNAARIAKASATDAVQIAEADLLEAKSKVGKVRAEGLQIKADYAVMAKNKEAVDETERTARQEKYKTDLEAAQAEVTRCEGLLQTAKDNAAEAKRIADAAEASLKTANKDLRAATSDATQHFTTAVRADREATKIGERIAGPSLGRVVSDHGTGAGAMRNWKCDLVDVAAVPLETLRHLIDPEALRVAGRKWMLGQPANTKARQMPGFSMYEDDVGVIG